MNQPKSDHGYRRSAGIVPVFLVGEQPPRFLLLRLYKYWEFPKGRVDRGETDLEAAVREASEEAGLSRLEFPWGQGSIETEPYSRPPKVVRYYIARVPSTRVTIQVNPELGRAEHHEARWCQARQARRLLGPRLRRVLDWALTVIEPVGPNTKQEP